MVCVFVCSLVKETIPDHENFDKDNSLYRDLDAKCGAYLDELEALAVQLRKKDLRKIQATPFRAKRPKDAVMIRAGHVAGLTWDPDASVTKVQLGKDDVDALDALGTEQWDARMRDASSANVPTKNSILNQFPNLNISLDLPSPSEETSSRHMIFSDEDLSMSKDVQEYLVRERQRSLSGLESMQQQEQQRKKKKSFL